MNGEPLYQPPMVTKGVPPSAAAKEDRLRAIRAAATVADKLDAYRKLLGVAP